MASADIMMPLDVEALPLTMSSQLTPRSASQTLVGYQENHQIELFMQEMLGTVFGILPEDPFEYMTFHIANHRPAPPPAQDDSCCGSGALWVLLPGGDPLNVEHWRLRRCWLTDQGTFCISSTSANVSQANGGGLVISPPANVAPHRVPLELGASFREYGEEEAARPFAFSVAAGPNGRTATRLHLAAGSEEQRDEWFRLFGHFADADLREGPPPRSEKVLSPRVVEPSSPALSAPLAQATSQTSASAGYPARGQPLQPELLKPQPATFTNANAVNASNSSPSSVLRSLPLKPILKSKPTHPGTHFVPAIRIPARISDDPMEASSCSRRTSIRFSNDVERREFPVERAKPVPLGLRAHESRRKAAVTMGTQDRPAPEQAAFVPSPRSPREGTSAADFIDVNLLPPAPPLPPAPGAREPSEVSVGKSAPPPVGPPAPPPACRSREPSEVSVGKSAPPPVGPPAPPSVAPRSTSHGQVEVDEAAKSSMTPQLSREQALGVAAKVLAETLGVQDGDSEKREEDVKQLLGSWVEKMEASPVNSARSIASSQAEAITSRVHNLAAEAASLHFASRPASSCSWFSAASSDFCRPVIQSLVGGLMAEVEHIIVEDRKRVKEATQLLLRPSTAELDGLTDQVLSARIAAGAAGEISRAEAKVIVKGVISSVFDEPQLPALELSNHGFEPTDEQDRLTELMSARSSPSAVLSAHGSVSPAISQCVADALTSKLLSSAVESPRPKEVAALTEQLMQGRGGSAMDGSFDITDDLVQNIVGDIFDRPLRRSPEDVEHEQALKQHALTYVRQLENLAAALEPEIVDDVVQRTVETLIQRSSSLSQASSGLQAPAVRDLEAIDVALLSRRSSRAGSLVQTLAESEANGDVASDMLDAMMLDPILSLMEEPLDPALFLLGDSEWEELGDPSFFFGLGTSAADFIDVVKLPFSSRSSQGAFSATQSELYADVFEDAAVSLVNDILEASNADSAKHFAATPAPEWVLRIGPPAEDDEKAETQVAKIAKSPSGLQVPLSPKHLAAGSRRPGTGQASEGDASFGGTFSARTAGSGTQVQELTTSVVDEVLQAVTEEYAKQGDYRQATQEKAAKAAELARSSVVARAAAEAAEARRETKALLEAEERNLPEPSPELRALNLDQKRPASEVAESGIEDVQNAVASEMIEFLLGNYQQQQLSTASELESVVQASGTGDSQVAMALHFSEIWDRDASFAGTEAADAIDVTMLPESDDDDAPLSLHFQCLDFKKVDKVAFKNELLDGFRSVGYPEERMSKLQITLREGSVIADIRGPLECLEYLKVMPLSSIQVMGSWAFVKLPGLQGTALPRKPNQGALSGISRLASDASQQSGRVEENMASAMVSGFMGTTTLAEAMFSRPRNVISQISQVSESSSRLEEGLATSMLASFISAPDQVVTKVAKLESEPDEMHVEVNSAGSEEPEPALLDLVMDLSLPPPSLQGTLSDYSVCSAISSSVDGGIARNLVSELASSFVRAEPSPQSEAASEFDAVFSLVSSQDERSVPENMVKSLMAALPEASAAKADSCFSKVFTEVSSEPAADAAAAIIADAMLAVPANQVFQTNLPQQVPAATFQVAKDAAKQIAENAMMVLSAPTEEVLSHLGADEEAQLPFVMPPAASSVAGSVAGFTAVSEDVEGSVAFQLVSDLLAAEPNVKEAQIPFVMPPAASSVAGFTVVSEDVEGSVAFQLVSNLLAAEPNVKEAQIPFVMPPAASSVAGFTVVSEDVEGSVAFQLVSDLLAAEPNVKEAQIPFVMPPAASSVAGFTSLSEDVEGSVALKLVNSLLAAEPQVPPAGLPSQPEVRAQEPESHLARAESAPSAGAFTTVSEDVEASVAHQIIRRALADPQVSPAVSSVPPTQDRLGADEVEEMEEVAMKVIKDAQVPFAMTPSAGSAAAFTAVSEDIEASASPASSARVLSDAGVASNASSELAGDVANGLVDKLLLQGLEVEVGRLRPGSGLSAGSLASPADFGEELDKVELEQDAPVLGMLATLTGMAGTQQSSFMSSQLVEADSWMSTGPPEGLEEATAFQAAKLQEAQAFAKVGKLPPIDQLPTDRSHSEAPLSAHSSDAQGLEVARQLALELAEHANLPEGSETFDVDAYSRVFSDAAFRLALNATNALDYSAGSEAPESCAGSAISGTLSGCSQAVAALAEDLAVHAVQAAAVAHEAALQADAALLAAKEATKAKLAVEAQKAASEASLAAAAARTAADKAASEAATLRNLAAVEVPQLQSRPLLSAPTGMPPLSQRSVGTRSVGSAVLDGSEADASDAAFVLVHKIAVAALSDRERTSELEVFAKSRQQGPGTTKPPSGRAFSSSKEKAQAQADGASKAAEDSARKAAEMATEAQEVAKQAVVAKSERAMSEVSVVFSTGPSEDADFHSAFEVVNISLDAADALSVSMVDGLGASEVAVDTMAFDAVKRSSDTAPAPSISVFEGSVVSGVTDDNMAFDAVKRSLDTAPAPSISVFEGSVVSGVTVDNMAFDAVKRSLDTAPAPSISVFEESVVSGVTVDNMAFEAVKRSLDTAPAPSISVFEGSVVSGVTVDNMAFEAVKRSLDTATAPSISVFEGSGASEVAVDTTAFEALKKSLALAPSVSLAEGSVATSAASEVADADAAFEVVRRSFDAARAAQPNGSDASEICDEDMASEAAVPPVRPPAVSSVAAFSVASEVADDDAASGAMRRTMDAALGYGPAPSSRDSSVAFSVASEVVDEDAVAEAVNRSLFEATDESYFAQGHAASVASEVIDEDGSLAAAAHYTNSAVAAVAKSARDCITREPPSPTSVAGESLIYSAMEGSSILIEDMASNIVNSAVMQYDSFEGETEVESEARTARDHAIQQAIQQALAEEEARLRAIVDAELKRRQSEQAEVAEQQAAAAAAEAARLASREAERLRQLEKEVAVHEQEASEALRKLAAQAATLLRAAEAEAVRMAVEEEARSTKAAAKELERQQAEEKSRLRALTQEETRLKRESEARGEELAGPDLARKESQLRLAAEEEAKQRAEEEEGRHHEALGLSSSRRSEAGGKARQLVQAEAERIKSERDTDSARLRAAQGRAARAQELAQEKARQAEQKSQAADSARMAASEAASRSPSDDNDILGRLMKTCANSAAGSLEVKQAGDTADSLRGSSAAPSLKGGATSQASMQSDDASLFELTATATQFPKRHAPEVTMQPSSDGGFWADGMAMSSTAPARLGMGSRQGTPIVPPLWEPHPRSDGFTAYGWKAGSEVTDSMADTSLYGTLLQDEDAVLPTFAPKFFAETQIPLSQRRDLVDPDAPTVKAPFSYRGAEYDDNRVPIFVPSSARAPGRSRQEGNFSPAKGSNLARGAGSASKEQLVDPKIISQLCSLLNPPDTPPSEYERIRQGPASAWASPEKVVKVGKDNNNTNSKLHRGEDVASLPLPVGIQAKPLGSAPQTKKEAESGLQDALSRLTRVLNMGADALMDTERSSSSTASWKRPLGASRHAPLIAEEEPDLRRELEGGMQQHLRRPTEAEISAMAGRIASAKRLDVAQEQQVRVMLRDIAESMFGEADSQGLASPEAKGRPPQLPAGGSGSRVGSSAHGPAQPHTARSSVKSMGSSNQSQDMDPVDTNEVLDLEVAGLMSELVGSLYAPAWESSSEA
ncbi:unnamed protein product [Polarella glacialis]|uniref:PH domain-containing protein n=1 Tax=Polarella glacialis TaxID=89957 RepID=A0A813E189_POLGL|nr:unnamed protein product [Polarella glacialis]